MIDVDSNLIGMAAGITTSCLWTFGVLLFALACKRIGSFNVNAYRIALATGFLIVANFIFLGAPLPVATREQWFWIGLSGIIGLGLGDIALFKAFVIAGPRLTVLVFSTSAIFSTIGAYIILGETIRPLGLCGIAITLAGIAVAVLGADKTEDNGTSKRLKIWGLILAAFGAFGQGIGAVLSKRGMLNDPSVILNPLSTALMRMLLGTLFIWMVALVFRKLTTLRKVFRDKEGMKQTVLAAIIGPFLGMVSSMVAIANTQAGVAQISMSLMPVLIIPVEWMLYRRKTCLQGILGAVTAVVGIAVLLLV